MDYVRVYDLKLEQKESIFIWGARRVGKTTFLKQRFKHSVVFNFLDSKQFLRYSKAPYLIREEILALPEKQRNLPIVIDEVQKIPLVLNEVHLMIEEYGLSFILCGSSARSLRQVGVNLLGGRAFRQYFYPLVFPEIVDFDLIKVLNQGTIPMHYLSNNHSKLLDSYINVYLAEEIKSESLVKRLADFSRFLDIVPYSASELINYANVARDCGVSAKTVKSYFEILVDTLIGYIIEPYTGKSLKRSIITATPKFYLFDVGVFAHLRQEQITSLKSSIAGKYFENYILQELIAYKHIKHRKTAIKFWRTTSNLEVDFILGDKVALEVKTTSNIKVDNLKGLKAFAKEYPGFKYMIVCNEPKRRLIQTKTIQILIYPYLEFLSSLWDGEIF